MSSMPGMMPGMGGMGQAPGQAPDFNKLFLAEKENVMITPHVWDMEDVEERLLKKYGKEIKATSAPVAPREVKKEPTVRDKIKTAQKSGNKRR